MKAISLYCGAGGIDEGLKQSGIETILAIDINKDCCETMKIHHPDCEVINLPVKDMLYSLPKADIVVGGPPCPEFSRANVHRTFDMCEVDNFWEAVSMVDPKYYLMENVIDIKKKLYKSSYLINSADYGVPQIRMRRYFTNLSWPSPTHAENPQKNLFGKTLKKWVSIKKALGLDGIIENREMFGYKKHQNKRSTDEPSDTLLCDGSYNGRWFILKKNKNLPNDISQPAKTIMAKDGGPHVNVIEDEPGGRKLTNEELAVLQGFPKGYEFYGKKGSVRRQIGNAVTPPVIHAFFKGLKS